ncbi:prolyl oligopeptidase family serine peptidase [soil metagenome]
MQPTFKTFTPLIFLLLGFQLIFSQQSTLSVEKIMQDPAWMGTFPTNVRWGEDSRTIYFNYNLQKDPADSLYKINTNNPSRIEKVSIAEQKKLISGPADFNKARTQKVFVRDGALMLHDIKSNNTRSLIDLGERITDPKFLVDGNRISFSMNNNLYVYHLRNGKVEKLTNIRTGESQDRDTKRDTKDEWVRTENLGLLGVVREREEKRDASTEFRKKMNREPFTFYTGKRSISNLRLSPEATYATFNLITRVDNKRTDVPDYVDASGYTVNLPARSKVGDEPSKVELAIYHIEKDTVIMAKPGNLPGLQDLPDYTGDYPDRTWEKKDRNVILSSAYFSDNGKQAVINVRSMDNKDRWISLLNLETGELKTLDRQRDEAWIAGPGIGFSFGGGTLGWLPDNRNIYFQSEESGYSHLYIMDVNTGNKKALTSGQYEVFEPFLSNDQKHWYLTTSQVGPGERHFYKMPVMGGKMEKLTQMTGNNNVFLSPDEKQMAILFSSSNTPWELYVKDARAAVQPKQLTSGRSEDFTAYDWREPEIISFKAQDGAMVPARLYKPTAAANNGAAVIFVHGAGYLQNVHKWWSSYFREYMFHNLLTDLGYTVLDIDYRGSAGYGRDWRTGIYRYMGGKDLSDHVDGAKYLVAQHGVDAKSVGIYGGSYGGFITLMAMFNEPETFKAGAALRSVTDWAHYNDGYTSNILNTPSEDPIAYQRSSPIYFAEGLEGHLLIAHGMVDINVHFQDVVRLAQRLIELKKENWEMAVYPVEDHGFVEPSSWTDEYKRILKLFNDTLIDQQN